MSINQTIFEQRRRFLDTPSGRISYVEQGDGPAALFVHGVIVNAYLWRHQRAALSGERRCIAIDLMAHGRTEIDPAQEVSFDAQATMLTQFLDALDLETADVVANDSGSGIAQIFAARDSQRVRSLTLTNGDVHDNWPPKEFAVFLDIICEV